VYLSGATFWYPHAGPGLVTFTLEAAVPAGWHVVSQGGGTSRDGEGRARWTAEGPMDEIYLVGGPLRVWRDQAGAVETLVYLHEDDRALAEKYLAATAQYLEMYRGLIGPYPYRKFALVENFWETGYGMPSFTLLGPSIVRFPFILASSYPHEILHNWWGNSVFVDYASGNWSEGLTAYLADHLIQEQRGTGDAYRRDTLKKYRNYVKHERDFPLVEFRGRESAATEAVGYGKTLMVFHMLRRELGDEAFRKMLAQFYRRMRGKQATFGDVELVASEVAGRSLASFFATWTTRAGAPELAIDGARVDQAGTEYRVFATIRQTQPGAPFPVRVPVAVLTADGTTMVTVDHVAKSENTPDPIFVSATRPLALVVDPQFDVFRRLDPRETPSSLGQLFGDARPLAVLPSAATDAERAMYRNIVSAWQSETQRVELVTDAELASLPPDRSVWLLGRENRHLSAVLAGEKGLVREADAVVLAGERVPFRGHGIVATFRHPADPDKAVGWIANDRADAAAGLARKLPHYGKYSYLAFEGAEPTNTVKGEWSAADSPLFVDLRPADARTTPLPAWRWPARKALAELPPAFSSASLADRVKAMAAPDREGRGLGSRGLERTAEEIARAFADMGLEPGGDAGTFFQTFTVPAGPGGTPVDTHNVIGILRGSDATLAGQSALLTAHYDHLGTGWPSPRQGDEGKVHPGADDNASGVAVMLELARTLASGTRPRRSLIFVAFSAEEAGLAGSRHFVQHPPPDFAAAGIVGVVNLDTVGRLGSGKVLVLGADTASEWPHIFRGGSFVTGVESQAVSGSYEASDQRSFIEQGVPAVQIFTGPHADYHRPTDTADRVDAAGLVKVATLVREAIAYLGERPTPLTVTIPAEARSTAGGAHTAAAGTRAPRPGADAPTGAAAQGARSTASGATASTAPGTRRVSFGAVPDFTFEGTGVRLDGVVPGSAAEKAGLAKGDVVTALDGIAVDSLRAFSERLRTLAPGQTVKVQYTRDGRPRTADATLTER